MVPEVCSYCSPNLKTLIELERHDMLRSGNRESDGAVVYRIV